jgi:hypothetical protein
MKLPAWTASSVGSFISCPHKYYRLRVVRDVKDFPRSEQQLYGTKLHKMVENAVAWGDPIPDAYPALKKIVEQIKKIPGEKLPEFRFSITEDFQKCGWKEAWCRGAADLVIRRGSEAIILDYKTGKRKPTEQLALYAGFAFAYWPELTKVHTGYVWLKDHKIDKKTYTKDDVPVIWQTWMPLVQRMQRAYESDQWIKRPSGLCAHWCPVKDCEFCGE